MNSVAKQRALGRMHTADGDQWVYNAQTDSWQRVFGSGLEARAYSFAESVIDQTIYALYQSIGYQRIGEYIDVEPDARRLHPPNAPYRIRVR